MLLCIGPRWGFKHGGLTSIVTGSPRALGHVTLSPVLEVEAGRTVTTL